MWTLFKLLALGAVIAMAVLLPFAFAMSCLLMREPPNLTTLRKRVVGKVWIPNPSSAPHGRRNT
jgi:hypothetical protein